MLIASGAHQRVKVRRRDETRAKYLASIGFSSMDALHLACAESASTDVFLTTDDRLLKLAGRLSSELKVSVENPLAWLRGVGE